MKNVKNYLQRLKMTWFSNNIGYDNVRNIVLIFFLKFYGLLIKVVSTETSIPLVIYEMHTFCGCRLAVEQFVNQRHSVTKDKLLYIFLIANLIIHYRSMTK
jgi:hypothetical protein